MNYIRHNFSYVLCSFSYILCSFRGVLKRMRNYGFAPFVGAYCIRPVRHRVKRACKPPPRHCKSAQFRAYAKCPCGGAITFCLDVSCLFGCCITRHATPREPHWQTRRGCHVALFCCHGGNGGFLYVNCPFRGEKCSCIHIPCSCVHRGGLRVWLHLQANEQEQRARHPCVGRQ